MLRESVGYRSVEIGHLHTCVFDIGITLARALLELLVICYDELYHKQPPCNFKDSLKTVIAIVNLSVMPFTGD